MAYIEVYGEPSVRIATASVEAWITRSGGHMAPVTFRLGDRNVQPFHIAPFADEGFDGPPILRALRGDFFCLPFGANAEPFRGERHPLHGETANADWELVGQSAESADFELVTSIRPGKVSKSIQLVEGHSAVYVRHVLRDMEGPMCFGHHAMLRFQSEGILSTSPFSYGQVFPGEFESPRQGGYTSLQPGAKFTSLDAVPLASGGEADLTRYPSRDGFEDLVQIFSHADTRLAWNAVTFSREGYVWFSIRNPSVLTGTILWHSNGGRHYAPWNGRHRRVLGIEDVTSYMHYGLEGSVSDNPAQRAGMKTSVMLETGHPLDVRTIFGVIDAPADFGAVHAIEPIVGGIQIYGADQSIFAPLDPEFVLL